MKANRNDECISLLNHEYAQGHDYRFEACKTFAWMPDQALQENELSYTNPRRVVYIRMSSIAAPSEVLLGLPLVR
jgi:hypothetical protein